MVGGSSDSGRSLRRWGNGAQPCGQTEVIGTETNLASNHHTPNHWRIYHPVIIGNVLIRQMLFSMCAHALQVCFNMRVVFVFLELLVCFNVSVSVCLCVF